MALSKSQIDKLGDRLRAGDVTDDDLRLLDQYGQSFAESLDRVVGVLRGELGLTVTARRTKTTRSIRNKLRRENIKLSRMQDIAGCRVVVDHIVTQEKIVHQLTSTFTDSKVIDRRVNPKFGYRAVHYIVAPGKHPVEIQVRTGFQDDWAQMSERLAANIDPSIKYGGGWPSLRFFLDVVSDNFWQVETELSSMINEAERLAELDPVKSKLLLEDAKDTYEKGRLELKRIVDETLAELNIKNE